MDRLLLAGRCQPVRVFVPVSLRSGPLTGRLAVSKGRGEQADGWASLRLDASYYCEAGHVADGILREKKG